MAEHKGGWLGPGNRARISPPRFRPGQLRTGANLGRHPVGAEERAWGTQLMS